MTARDRWYRVTLGGGPGPARVVVPGAHLGAALATAVARRRGAWPAAVARVGPDEVPLGDAIGKAALATALPADAAPAGPWAPGVIAAESATDLGALRPGWVRHDGPGLVLEAQAPGARTIETFLALAEALPAIDNVELTIRGHYDDGDAADEVWLSPRLDVRRALRFLDDHDRDLLSNGHVEVALYVRAEQATLRLTEHKTIAWLAADDATATRTAAALAAHDLPPLAALVTLADRPHHHHRDPRASDRARLLRRLASMRLRRVA